MRTSKTYQQNVNVRLRLSVWQHPTTSGHWWTNTGTDGKHPDQFDGEPLGNDDRIGGKVT